MESTITVKGQATIPKSIRQHFRYLYQPVSPLDGPPENFLSSAVGRWCPSDAPDEASLPTPSHQRCQPLKAIPHKYSHLQGNLKKTLQFPAQVL